MTGCDSKTWGKEYPFVSPPKAVLKLSERMEQTLGNSMCRFTCEPQLLEAREKTVSPGRDEGLSGQTIFLLSMIDSVGS